MGRYKNIILVIFIFASFLFVLSIVKGKAPIKNKVNTDAIQSDEVDDDSNIIIIINPTIEEKRRRDPEIKIEQSFEYNDGEFDCTTDGWDHGKITFHSFVYGTFEEIKRRSKEEKEKCDNFLYEMGASVDDSLNVLKSN
jgi:hypothetical protein